ncbi:hypothetical protein [Sphaerimonospora mesophila]
MIKIRCWFEPDSERRKRSARFLAEAGWLRSASNCALVLPVFAEML